jgi:hypothetical protein
LGLRKEMASNTITIQIDCVNLWIAYLQLLGVSVIEKRRSIDDFRQKTVKTKWLRGKKRVRLTFYPKIKMNLKNDI